MSDNIFDLWLRHGEKRIMVKRSSKWGKGNWCIVNKCICKPPNKDGAIYGVAFGHIHYADGNVFNGAIPNCGCGGWEIIKVLD